MMKQFIMILLAIGLQASAREIVDDNQLVLWYNVPSKDWNEALPLGNGRLGAMVFGGIEEERLQVNDDTFWTGDPSFKESIQSNGPKHLPKIRRLVFENKWQEAQELWGKVMPDGIGWNKYQPVGDILLSFPEHQEITHYRRDLNLDTAIATVSYQHKGVVYTREYFSSPVDNVLMMRITASEPGALNFSVTLSGSYPEKTSQEDYTQTRVLSDNSLRLMGRSSNGSLHYRAKLLAKTEGGHTIASSGRLYFKQASAVTLFFSVATNFVNFRDISGNAREKCDNIIESCRNKTFDELKTNHITEYQRLFRKAHLSLPASDFSVLPTNERLDAIRNGGKDPQLCVLLFQFGRYLMICSSRPGSQPPNLQGIWNDRMNPPWNSMYTSNINIEMNYWAVNSANLSECIEPLVRFVEDVSLTGQINARDKLGFKGWYMSLNTDLWRNLGPLRGWSFYDTWTTGGAWYCNALWDHYEFNGDQKYLVLCKNLMLSSGMSDNNSISRNFMEYVMNKKYIVRLSDEERKELVAVITKLKGTSQKVKRAQILLKADVDGPNWPHYQISEAFLCRTKTVSEVCKSLVERGFDITVNGKKRDTPPRAKLLDGRQEAKIIALRLGEPPEGYSNWSLRLIAEKTVELGIVESISHTTVSTTLKKMK